MLSVKNIFLWHKVCNTEFSLWQAKDKTTDLRHKLELALPAIILSMSHYIQGKNSFEY